MDIITSTVRWANGHTTNKVLWTKKTPAELAADIRRRVVPRGGLLVGLRQATAAEEEALPEEVQAAIRRAWESEVAARERRSSL